MSKAIYYAITVIILISFAFLMNSGDYLRKPFTNQDDVAACINNLEKNIMEENWEEANQNYTDLKKAWEKIVVRIQFSVEKDEINFIDVNLARLGGYLKTKGKKEALAELYEMEEHWNNLNN